jgi:hypothetical protein
MAADGETMATRSQQSRAEEQRQRSAANSRKKKTGGSKPGIPRSARSADKGHAGKKATYALEAPVAKRASRKSTRRSANRAKPASTIEQREEVVKGTPTARFRKSRARATKPRGHGS